MRVGNGKAIIYNASDIGLVLYDKRNNYEKDINLNSSRGYNNDSVENHGRGRTEGVFR